MILFFYKMKNKIPHLTACETSVISAHGSSIQISSRHVKHGGFRLKDICYISNPLTFIWISLILSVLFFIPKSSNAEGLVDAFSVWENEITLQDRRRYVVQWTATDSRIIFRVTAKTRGYIGFGFHTKPQMHGSDIVVG